MIKKILFSLFSFISLFDFASADCITGYACSINSIKIQNQFLEEKFLLELKEHFDFNINEDFFLGNINDNVQYKDFFPFSMMFLEFNQGDILMFTENL